MNKYEMMYILKSDLTDESREAVIAKFENIVKTAGGAVEKTEKMGVKKLAYEIAYKSEGYYVLMTFTAEPTVIAELERVSNITEEMLRRLVVKL